MLQNSGSAQPLPPEPVDGERTLAVEVYPDVQMAIFWTTECPILADSRRSGDEIHPWSPNGGLQVLPRSSGHLGIGAIMRWEVSDDKEEAI